MSTGKEKSDAALAEEKEEAKAEAEAEKHPLGGSGLASLRTLVPEIRRVFGSVQNALDGIEDVSRRVTEDPDRYARAIGAKGDVSMAGIAERIKALLPQLEGLANETRALAAAYRNTSTTVEHPKAKE
jgi:hypothetical protein